MVEYESVFIAGSANTIAQNTVWFSTKGSNHTSILAYCVHNVIAIVEVSDASVSKRF